VLRYGPFSILIMALQEVKNPIDPAFVEPKRIDIVPVSRHFHSFAKPWTRPLPKLSNAGEISMCKFVPIYIRPILDCNPIVNEQPLANRIWPVAIGVYEFFDVMRLRRSGEE